MLGATALGVFTKAFLALSNDLSKEKSKTATIAKSIINHPIKIIAAFITAPILIIKMAFVVKNPIRRVIAFIGLFLSVLAAYVAGTFIGSAAGALFIASKIGILVEIGFLLGTTLSIFLSVCFSLVVLNSVSYLFLKINTEEVVEYLCSIST